MEKILAAARGKPGSKCGCALEATKKAPVKPRKEEKPSKDHRPTKGWPPKKVS